jgi:hypothetical protein
MREQPPHRARATNSDGVICGPLREPLHEPLHEPRAARKKKHGRAVTGTKELATAPERATDADAHPKRTIDHSPVMRQPIQLCPDRPWIDLHIPKCSHTSHRLFTTNVRVSAAIVHTQPHPPPHSGCPRCPHAPAPAHTSRSFCSCPSPSSTTRRPRSNNHHPQGKGSWPPSPIASAGPSLEAAWGRRRASRSGRAPRR